MSGAIHIDRADGSESVRLAGGFGAVDRDRTIPLGEITRSTPRSPDDLAAEVADLRRENARLRERLAECRRDA